MWRSILCHVHSPGAADVVLCVVDHHSQSAGVVALVLHRDVSDGQNDALLNAVPSSANRERSALKILVPPGVLCPCVVL